MQKISPLRSSIEAFNKFRAARKAAGNAQQLQETKVQTNPFGITFKGTVIQMDVFDKTEKAENTEKTNSFKEKIQNTGKLLASAWVGTINKFSSLKTNAIAFGNKLKDNTVAYAKKAYEFASAPIEFNVFKYNVSNLQNKPVGELRTMLANELQGATNE
ncbi:MAG: hypothetical protein IJ877_04920 [Candidatus Gastranaerophilales bacterium]|nr:hypothetical protein [Candidatus Gastranaerophilales bacterium]